LAFFAFTLNFFSRLGGERLYLKFSVAASIVAPLPRFLEAFEAIAAMRRWETVVADDAKHVVLSRCFRVFWQAQLLFSSTVGEIESKLAMLAQFREAFLQRRASTMTTTTLDASSATGTSQANYAAVSMPKTSESSRKSLVKTYWPPVFAFLESYGAKCKEGTLSSSFLFVSFPYFFLVPFSAYCCLFFSHSSTCNDISATLREQQ
jgi:hypothetical protein